MTEFIKWRSIDKFSDAYIKAQKYGVRDLMFRPKIKLHGTNAAIQIKDGKTYAQKRTDFITVVNDNCGFAQFETTLVTVNPEFDLVIYGEWAGPGVQKTDAVCGIPQKAFFVFAILDLARNKMIYEPDMIKPIIEEVYGENHEEQRVFVLPWYDETFDLVNMTDQKDCQDFIDHVMKEVDEVIGECDPYIKKTFGIEGPGEGLVFYASHGSFIDGTELPHELLSSYMFKAKTEIHSVQKTKERNHVAPERPEGVDDFIEMFFTEQRFEQMLEQIGGVADRAKTGEFLKAVMSDVHKESANEIELASFEWKDVPKYAVPRVKQWWFRKCDELFS